jgi:serine/threonine protein kinase
MPRASESLSTAPSHVTETHHITKDYDQRTGAKTINRYEFHGTIGRGVHGKVKLAKDIETGEFVAIKIVNRVTRKRLGRWNPMEAEQKIRREIAIMKKCKHPNVVALREVMDDPDSKKIYLGMALLGIRLTVVLEYMGGGQLQWRDSDDNPVLNIEQIRSIIRDTVLGLEYLHFQGIIHRDIKPANLLLDDNHRVKISDFGVSHLSKIDEETGEALTENDLDLSKTAGSPAFFAPELCQTSSEEKRPVITKAIDVWALGITLHCLLFGRTPFPETGVEFQLFNMICNEPIPIPPPEFEEADVDEEVRDLLKRLLIKDPEARITLEEVKHHPFILRNVSDPARWIEESDPRHGGAKLEVTAEEVSDAVSLTERVKRTLYKIQMSLGLTGLRRRATTGRMNSSTSKRSTSVSTVDAPSSPDSRELNYSRRGSQASIESTGTNDTEKNRISVSTSRASSRHSPPQGLSRKSSSSKPTLPLPPLPPPVDPTPLRPSRSMRSSSRGRSTTDYYQDSSQPSMPRSRAISDLSRNVNGETTNYLIDDYSNGLYFADDDLDFRSPHEEDEEDEDEGHFLIDFGKRRKSRQEAETVAKQVEEESKKEETETKKDGTTQSSML